MAPTRRQLLSGVGAVAAGALSGCLGDEVGAVAEGSESATVRSSFFVFGDLASSVAGDAATAELLVPVGQHGHGWEPGPKVREEIHGADLLVHGPTGFQPWVDDVRRDLGADGSDVTTVDASAGLDLLAAGEGHQHDEDDGHADDGHTDHDEHDENHDDHTDDEHDGHDGTGADPHFWMDPIRTAEAVGTVRRGLADVDPDGADAYAANAERLRERLDELHGRIEGVVADGSTGVVLVAGHDSFAYLEDRYGVDVRALTGVSPDDRPTTRDVERAQGIVEDHGLRYVCADPLESQRAAEQLVAETDAEAVLPLTAMPGLRAGWEEDDWGYVEVMENVNRPTLERALDA